MDNSVADSASADRLGRYLTPLSAWALSFGCAVGWGAFIMPGTTFLPVAGPVGTLIGLGVGALVMFLVGRNYHYLIQNFPEAGGAYGYVKRVCGGDHGYICGWFLILTYIAIAWANATALALIGRHLLKGMFSFGFRYEIAGYDVYAGEILLSVSALAAVCAAFLRGKRFAARVQTFFAVVLCLGVAVCVAAVFARGGSGLAAFTPAFSGESGEFLQVVAIVALAPWAFVGFESVSHSAEEFAFPRSRTVYIITFSLIAATAAYAALTLVAAAAQPEGFADWREYMAARGSLDGLGALPVFYVVKTAMGTTGLVILCVTTLAAIATGLVGHVVAASRLVYAMSRDGLLCDAFARLDRDGSPRNAIVAMLAISCLIPFVGRTAVGWVVDVTTIGASVAYGYVSFCAFAVARREKRPWVMLSGAAGVFVSVAFMTYFLVPNFWVVDALATESYFILSVWSIVGLVVFRTVFNRDKSGRLGTSTVAWLVLLFFIFFSGHMWNRQMTRGLTDTVVSEIAGHYQATRPRDASAGKRMDPFFSDQKDRTDDALTRYNLIQIALMVIALAIMYSLYAVITRREREASKAKSYFFSTISHDIRTPLNAIVGFSEMLKLGFKTKEEGDEAIDSILIGSKSLLAFVNDILDLSRRESGESGPALIPTDCTVLLREVEEAFRVGTPKKGVEMRAAVDEMPSLLVDPLLLRHIVSNLVSNAEKFTERGRVEVRGRFERGDASDKTGTLVVEIEDTGVGISDEDKAKILSPYTQTESKIARNGGTGLSLAVCSQLTEEMGGELSFESELGKGSTFRIRLPNVAVSPEAAKSDKAGAVQPEAKPPAAAAAPRTPRLLLVDDQKMNLTVLKAMIKRVGVFEMETAADGREALARLRNAGLPKIDAVLTDMWMPELDGEGLVKAIRADKDLAKTPVHVITADVELQETYAEKGFDSIVLKPITVANIGPLVVGLAEAAPPA